MLVLGFSTCLLFKSIGSRYSYRANGGGCQGHECPIHDTHIALRVSSIGAVANVLVYPTNHAHAIANDFDDWDDVFAYENSGERPIHTQITPLGDVQLVKGVRRDWIGSVCESCIYEGRSNRHKTVWLIVCTHASANGDLHPLCVEFLIALSLRALEICPEPLYLSVGSQTVYGSFTKAEVRYMVYEIPSNSEFITNVAFSNPDCLASHIQTCCRIMVELTSVLRTLHRSGVGHGKIKDDSVILRHRRDVFLINLASVSSEEKTKVLDMTSILDIFCYIASLANASCPRAFVFYLERNALNRQIERHFNDLRSLLTSGYTDTHDRVIQCFDKIQYCF